MTHKEETSQTTKRLREGDERQRRARTERAGRAEQEAAAVSQRSTLQDTFSG